MGDGEEEEEELHSEGRKTVKLWRTEKDGRRQRRMEAVKPVGGPAIIKAEHQEEEYINQSCCVQIYCGQEQE